MTTTLHRLQTLSDIRTYVLAGHALFTVLSASGKHMTYAVSRAKEKADKAEENAQRPWFVRARSGEDAYIGTLWPRPDGGLRFAVATKQGVSPDAAEVKAFFWFVAQMCLPESETRLLVQAQVLHHNVCGACGIELTHPDSIASGIGPDCARRLGIARPKVKRNKAAKAAA